MELLGTLEIVASESSLAVGWLCDLAAGGTDSGL